MVKYTAMTAKSGYGQITLIDFVKVYGLLFWSFKSQISSCFPVFFFNGPNRYVNIPMNIFFIIHGSVWSSPKFQHQVIVIADIKILGDYSIRRLNKLGNYYKYNKYNKQGIHRIP